MADRPLIDGLAELARARDGEVSAGRDVEQRSGLIAALSTSQGATRPGKLRLLWAAAAVTVTVLLAVALWPSSALDYRVQGAELAAEGYLRAAEEPVEITFSEGTTFTFAAGSAGRLLEVDSNGARVMLERGTVIVDVAARDGARWSVAAGPYAVQVTGTRFELSWEPTAEQLALTMHAGAVRVRGPMVDQGLEVTAGQQLVARVPERVLKLGEAGEPLVASSAAPVATPTGSTTPVPSGTAPEPVAEPPTVAWSELVAKGKFDRVLRQAEAHGIDGVLSGGTLDQVVALGDAARYRGRGALARRCLTIQRARFGGTGAAKSAAFLLGRMSESSPAAAIGWYDRYLSEDPGGAYAAEALGRKLTLLARSDPGGAKTLARRYLAAYPKGAYAGFARRLLAR